MTNEEIFARELNGEELDFVLCNPINFQDCMDAAREEGRRDEQEKSKELIAAARKIGRREGAIGFHKFTSIMGFQMIVEHKSGIPYFFNGTNKFNVDEVYDLYLQSPQKTNDNG